MKILDYVWVRKQNSTLDFIEKAIAENLKFAGYTQKWNLVIVVK